MIDDRGKGISVRRAASFDEERVSALTDAAYSKWVPVLGRKPQPMTTDYAAVIAAHLVWLLHVEEVTAGVLVLMHELDALLIYSVAIHPSYQGQGFGRRLLKLAEEEARKAGYSSIRLYTNALMEENIALYKRLGYEETHQEAYQGSTIVHLAKQFAGQTSPG